MTKIFIIEEIYEKVGFSKREITKIVESVCDIIKETLQHEDKVVVSGFGKFGAKNKRTRIHSFLPLRSVTHFTLLLYITIW